MRERLADGRYGPVFLARDAAADQLVVIRVFADPGDLVQRALFLDALQHACDAPLQHASIGRPLTCGLSNERVYVVHSYLPGQQADQWVRAQAPRPLSELLLPLAGMAAAVDYAGAAGVHHGALTAGDLIVDGDTGGVTGWGIEQARAAAGLTQATPSHAGDIASLARAVFELLAPSDAPRVREVFERAWSSDPEVQPSSALAFAAALQEAVDGLTVEPEPVMVEPDPAMSAPERFVDDTPALPDLPFLQTFEPVLDRGATLSDSPVEPERLAPRQPEQAWSDATPTFTVREEQPQRSWISVAAVAVIMLAAGFAGGLFVGRQQSVTVTPVPAVPVAAATTGQAFTDAPVVEAERPAAAPRPAADQPPAPQAEIARQPESSPGTLQIDSRPQGAQVFVDGKLVGRTPVLAGGLRPGQHLVRMELPRHREWRTNVTVGAGEHGRIGGSLEEIY